ncbi:threonine-phosphate decarboxylase [Aliikangiella maris]|uniref:Aminotransferase n=2 Tax=Aliikangiella maris TaxID=3162458 RepID=A0ABV3MQX5_9GAMM
MKEITLPVVHGGQLSQVAAKFGLDDQGWLDLSTGISPISYPVPEVPVEYWQKLPHVSEQLLQLAQSYYRADNVLISHGSQSIIQCLPKIIQTDLTFNSVLDGKQPLRVWIPASGYREHRYCWQKQQASIIEYQQLPLNTQIKTGDIVVVINPNNPTGELYQPSFIHQLAQQLAQKQGWLIIDEAFMDVCAPEYWYRPAQLMTRCIVLRSTGKFFGLAGIRAGCVIANDNLLTQIATELGPWHVNGVALWAMEQALADTQWQLAQRQRLAQYANALLTMLTRHFPGEKISGTDLFKTVYLANSQDCFEQLCQQKVYVRLCDEKNALRFGIPLPDDLDRLDQALLQLKAYH